MVTIQFDIDLGNFKALYTKANSLSSFFKDLRIEELMTSHKLTDIANVITSILTQFKNIVRI